MFLLIAAAALVLGVYGRKAIQRFVSVGIWTVSLFIRTLRQHG
jgi:hypothetical protein